MRIFSVLLFSIFLAACGTTAPEHETVSTPQTGWWHDLDDPLLNQLADSIVDKNLDVAAAISRLDEARAIRRAAQSDLFPQVDGTARATRGKRERNIPANRTLEAGFDAAWELDLFGGTQAEIRGAKASEAFATADIEDVKQSVIADLGRAVIEWRLALEQTSTLQNLLRAQNDQISIFAAREKAGLSDATLTARARALAAQSAVQLPLFAADEQRAQFQIERLMGVAPRTLTPFLKKRKAGLRLPERAVAVLYASAADIQQRPDIRKAAAQIDFSTAEIAQARAALFPSISLNSFFGVQDVRNALSGNPVWNVGASLTTPIFRFGKLRAAVDAANAREKQALLNYENVTLIALQEIQTALSDYINGLDAITRQQEALIRRMDTTKLARERFTRGITNMTDLTTAQAEQDEAALSLVQQKATTLIAYIRLQKALGWTNASSGDDAGQGEAQTPSQPQSQD